MADDFVNMSSNIKAIVLDTCISQSLAKLLNTLGNLKGVTALSMIKCKLHVLDMQYLLRVMHLRRLIVGMLQLM
jgi:hypothetical protein